MNYTMNTSLWTLLIFLILGCSQAELPPENPARPEGSVVLIVKGTMELTEEEFRVIAKERAPQFEAIPGIIQKYYIKTQNPGEFGGVYIWDSMESLQEYRESELARTIAEAYQVTGPLSIEVQNILFELRD